MPAFWDRESELSRIRRRLGGAAFGYVTGRRRVGKTALLLEAIRRFGGLYHQAVEGTAQQQLLHFADEIGEALPIFRDVVPRTWSEFFRLLSRASLPPLMVWDEFPYWSQGDAGLASLAQKWVDHELPKRRTLLLLSGSAQSMLYSQFLSHASPLYGRASLRIHLEPLGYPWFCRALGYDPDRADSFVRFSLVGGVPHYWKLMPRGTPTQQAAELYFEPSAILAEEPVRLIRDEGVVGALPKAILDLVGRGVARPSELASRLGTAQGNLSRPLALLLELGLIHRELPFGESSRTTKRVLYGVQDPALAFYYGTYLPSRSRWKTLPAKEVERLLHGHASRCWERFCRQAYPGSGRYWEAGVELDMVWRPDGKKRALVAECKWSRVGDCEGRSLLEDLRARFCRSALARRFHAVDFRVFSQRDLPEIARRFNS
ncbi:MAG: ATP-binding protein [Elusimicrobia bacterium]|nr:ATP-binding protein [Elusimicrobiota bacterium]